MQRLDVAVKDGQVLIGRSNDDRKIRALHGLTRAELSNMVKCYEGV